MHIIHILCTLFFVGAVYCHYESRRRVLNDAKPARKETVAQNNRKRSNKQSQKNVSFNECLGMHVSIG